MKLLKPQRLLPDYYKHIERELEAVFYEILYRPIVDTIKQHTGKNTRLNAKYEALEQAVADGVVQYQQDNKGKGIFSGKFNRAIASAIRDIGGSFDARQGIYRIEQNLVPASIKSKAALVQAKAKELNEALKRTIDRMQEGIAATMETVDITPDPAIDRIDHDFVSRNKDIVVTPVLSDSAKARLSDDYTTNMKLYIKKWSEDHIHELREITEENAKAGYRFENLVDMIRTAHGTTQAKATFLARQETGLFMAKYRKQRLGDVGCTQYKWSARSASLTRPDHWALHRQIFSYDSPPVTDRKTGRRGNPGEDYGCLCADIPILGRAEVAA
jgi:SPP1 gp7 family putative phage head morphogenesis protein